MFDMYSERNIEKAFIITKHEKSFAMELKKFDDVVNSISKELQIGFTETVIIVGILHGQGRIEIRRSHGRGVGYFNVIDVLGE